MMGDGSNQSSQIPNELQQIQSQLISQQNFHQSKIEKSQKKIIEEQKEQSNNGFIDISDLYKSESHKDFEHIPYNVNYFLPKDFETFLLTGDFNQFNEPSSTQTDKNFELSYIYCSSQISQLGRVQPIFITGCGRSGTTLMFKLLSQALLQNHKNFISICLNEPREIYLNAFNGGVFDIWSKQSEKENCSISMQNPKKYTDVECLNHIKTLLKYILELFITHPDYVKAKLKNKNEQLQFNESVFVRQIYLEKMPEHIMRVPLLIQIFPLSKFLYVRRNWVDVAQSISSFGSNFNWYGFKDAKWDALIRFIQENSFLSEKMIPDQISNSNQSEEVKETDSNIDKNKKWCERILQEEDMQFRGIIEWLISENSYYEYKQTPQYSSYIVPVKYEDLVNSERLEDTIKLIWWEIGIQIDIEQAKQEIKTKDSQIDKKAIIQYLKDENQEDIKTDDINFDNKKLFKSLEIAKKYLSKIAIGEYHSAQVEQEYSQTPTISSVDQEFTDMSGLNFQYQNQVLFDQPNQNLQNNYFENQNQLRSQFALNDSICQTNTQQYYQSNARINHQLHLQYDTEPSGDSFSNHYHQEEDSISQSCKDHLEMSNTVSQLKQSPLQENFDMEQDEYSNLSEWDLQRMKEAESKVLILEDYDHRKITSIKNEVNMLCQVIEKVLEKSITKDFMQQNILPKLKQNPQFHDSELLWKINLMMRRKGLKKSEVSQVIASCLEFLILNEVKNDL
eukprot:403344310